MDTKRFELTEEEIWDIQFKVIEEYRKQGKLPSTYELDRPVAQAQIAKVLSLLEPVELEALEDEALLEMVKYIPNKITLCSAVIKATNQHNQSNGQLYRIREGK